MSELIKANSLIETYKETERKIEIGIDKFLVNRVLPIMKEKGYEKIKNANQTKDSLTDRKLYFRKPIPGAQSYFYDIAIGIKLDSASPHIGLPLIYLLGELPITLKGFHREINLMDVEKSLRQSLEEYEMVVGKD